MIIITIVIVIVIQLPQDRACEGASDIFGEVQFLNLVDRYRTLPYNNSLNYTFL